MQMPQHQIKNQSKKFLMFMTFIVFSVPGKHAQFNSGTDDRVLEISAT